MSLEALLEENNKLVARHNELLEKMLNFKDAKADKGKAEDGDDKPARRTRTTKDEPEDKPTRRTRTTKDEPEEKTTRSRKSSKAPTVEELKKAGDSFIDVDDDDEYEERRKIVKAIARYFDAERFTEIGEADRKIAIDLLTLAKGDGIDIDDLEGEIEALTEGDKPEEKEEKPARRRRSADD